MMANAAMRQVARLFEEGAATAQGDGQLLARFALDRDERAFEALVDRHGSMVWATCRAVLRDPHDAEDAFQAAFVALARRSASITQGGALGGWLHRVAYREAVRVGSEAARRRASERAAALARAESGPAEGDADLRAAVHAELDRLPEVYRLPLVLCDLEGLSKAEAAHRLGWTEGSVRGRLDRARERLRTRLARRGLGTPAGALVVALGQEAPAAVPAVRAAAAVRAALSAPGVAGTLGLASALASLRLGLAASLLVGSAGLIAGLLALGRGPAQAPPIGARPPMARAPAPSPTPAPAQATASKPADPAEMAGRVVGPDGKPVAGARIYRPLDWIGEESVSPVRPKVHAVSGADGRFRFAIDRAEGEAHRAGWKGLEGQLLALAEGFGPGFGAVGEAGGEATLTLALDDAPIEGRILDLEGRPVVGVSVRVESIQAPKAGTLDAWIEAARLGQKTWYELNNEHLDPTYLRDSDLGLSTSTDADGRFRLAGIGRERMVGLRVEGPTIRSSELHALTRAMAGLTLPVFPPNMAAEGPVFAIRETFHGRAFTHAAAPTRPIVGTVRDKATGAPIPGVSVRSYQMADRPIGNTQIVRTTADAQGRFRLVGMPRGKGNRIMVLPPIERDGPVPVRRTYLIDGKQVRVTPPVDGGYLGEIVDVEEGPPGVEPIVADVALRRGITIRGRVTDRATGKPVRALVRYHAFKDNPALKGVTGLEWAFQENWTEADGSYRAVGLPGRGLLSVQGGDAASFVPASADRPEVTNKLSTNTTPMFAPELIQGFAEIHPAEGETVVTRDLTVDSGRELSGRVSGPDGRPLEGVRFSDANLKEGNAWEALEKGEFSIRVASKSDPEVDRELAALFRPDPVPTRTLLFRDEARKLAASAVIRGDEPGPLAVALQPWASARGRLVDAEGKPRAGVGFRVDVAHASRLPSPFRTDGDGRFRVEGMIPGASHRIFLNEEYATLGDELNPKPGDEIDLGELQARRRD